MVPAAHAIIGAAKNKDVTTITEPATVYVARLACYSYTLLTCFVHEFTCWRMWGAACCSSTLSGLLADWLADTD